MATNPNTLVRVAASAARLEREATKLIIMRRKFSDGSDLSRQDAIVREWALNTKRACEDLRAGR